MKSKTIMILLLVLMAVMILSALLFPDELRELLDRPSAYRHVLFAHILVVTLFFANAVVGILWESRSLATGRRDIIFHTYETVAWLDARFSSPLIILSVITGVMLTFLLGDLWRIGWLSLAFLLFLFSGLVWVVSDIPTQYKIKKLIKEVDPDAETIPGQLMHLLKLRLHISLAGVVPLLAVFILMVYKPEITPVALWFR